MHHEVTTTAAASPETVWALLEDVERWPMWTRSMQRVELITEGPLALGSRIRVKQPRLAAATFVVTELDPGRSFSWRSTSAGVVTRATHEVAAAPAGTSTIDLRFEMEGLLAGPIGVVFGGLVRRYVQMEADGHAAAAAEATGT
jgi:uncharacterized protein YndB with AHSA1/START domain